VFKNVKYEFFLRIHEADCVIL